MAAALAAAGWTVADPLGRDDDPAPAGEGVDLVIVATPDAAVAPTAARIDPVEGREVVVAHLAGSLGLDVLDPHRHRAAVHPLVALPDAATGAARLHGADFAVAGTPGPGTELARRVVTDLGGRGFAVADDQRAAYHAAACIAANHLVALLAQVERVASPTGVPLDAFLDLARGALENVAALGPAAALTGPAARGDRVTLERHLDALDPAEHAAYRALAAAAARLAGREEEAG